MTSAIKNLYAILFAGLVLLGFGTAVSLGKVEYTKKEGKPCITCHVKNGTKELNDVGKCCEKNGSLKNCQVSDKKK